MSISYSPAVKANRLNVVNDALNGKTYAAGTGSGSAGVLVIGTMALSGATGVLATVNLSNPAAVQSGSTLTLAGVPLSATATAGGVAALAELRDGAGNVVASGLTVGLASADIIVSNTTITLGQSVSVTSGVITHG